MSASAHSLLAPELLPLGSSHAGVPNAREVFEDGYSWQHAISQLESQIHANGRSIDPLSHVDFPFFGKKENRAWGSQVLLAGPSISRNTDARHPTQQAFNHLLSYVAVLSRATTDIRQLYPADAELRNLHFRVQASYRQYQQGLSGNNVDVNSENLLNSLAGLTAVLTKPRGNLEFSPEGDAGSYASAHIATTSTIEHGGMEPARTEA